jgi:hypothetical protein
MRRHTHFFVATFAAVSVVGCYRIPLHIRENDATGYEEVGVPLIEAVEYTPNGRDIRVSLESPGYVTVLLVSPELGATVRFRRGEHQSAWADKGVHRFALDRLASPIAIPGLREVGNVTPVSNPPSLRLSVARGAVFDAAADARAVRPEGEQSAVALASRSVSAGFGAVKSAHIVVIVSEHPLDLVGVAMRLARSSLDPAIVAAVAADVVEGGRWMAAVAPLRGQ